MTIQELISWLGANQNTVFIYYSIILGLTLLSIAIVTQKNFKKLRYGMSVLVYAVTIPGILAVLLTAYALFFLKSNLLNVNMLVYFVPIIVMILVLVLLNKKVAMKDIPGFDKLSALMISISIAFSITFLLQKMFIGVFFIGGFSQLVIIFIVLLLVLKFAWSKLIK